jgi:hypothetical protein
VCYHSSFQRVDCAFSFFLYFENRTKRNDVVVIVCQDSDGEHRQASGVTTAAHFLKHLFFFKKGKPSQNLLEKQISDFPRVRLSNMYHSSSHGGCGFLCPYSVSFRFPLGFT